MSISIPPTTSPPPSPPPGTYSPPHPSSTSTPLRSPCPMMNSLANHGYLPRSGHSITPTDFYHALTTIVGLSQPLAFIISRLMLVDYEPPNEAKDKPKSLSKILAHLHHCLHNLPWSLLPRLSALGLHPPGQKDFKGRNFLNLDNLAIHGPIEHDISLTRLDRSQGDSVSPQPDLIAALVASSSDGGETLTMADLAAFRKRRIEEQKRAHRERGTELTYGPREHRMGNVEIALLLTVLGNSEDGERVRCEFVRALFQEERLPVREGWKALDKKVGAWTLGRTTAKVGNLMGSEEG